MKCPVCHHEYDDNNSICPKCNFPEVGRMFVNKEDAIEWIEKTVKPCKKVWNKSVSIATDNKNRLEDELEKYIQYKEFDSCLKRHPHDYKTRSWMIDYLSQIVVYRNNYPVDNRNELINETIKHINFFLVNGANCDNYRMNFTATAYKTVLAEIYLSEWDLISAMGCYYDYLKSKVFEDSILDIKNGESMALYNDDIYMVLHNCAVICRLLGNTFMMDKFDMLCSRVAEIEYNFEADKEYQSLYFRGIKRYIWSEENGEALNEHLKAGNSLDTCTYEKCCHHETIFSAELDTVDWVGHSINVKQISNYHVLETITNLENKEFIMEQRNGVTEYARRVLNLF